MRTLLLIAAIVLVFLIVRSLLRRARIEQEMRSRVEAPTKMIRCDRCGLHVPEHDAVRGQDGHVFCSEEHRRLGKG